MVNGKNKGNAFERKIYKELRELNLGFKRTLGSGSTDEPADIMNDKYCFELKHYKKITDGLINKWFNKLRKEALLNNKIPALIYKENRRAPLIMFESNGVKFMLFFSDWMCLIRNNTLIAFNVSDKID